MAQFFAVTFAFTLVHLADGAPGGLRSLKAVGLPSARKTRLHTISNLVSCALSKADGPAGAELSTKEATPRLWRITEQLIESSHGTVSKATASSASAREEVVIKISNEQIQQGIDGDDPDGLIKEANWYHYFTAEEVRVVPEFKFVGRLEREDKVVLITMYGGRDMQEEVQNTNRTLTLCETLHFGAQGLKALRELHTRGIIHRDIKPGNLLWSKKPGEGNFLPGELRIMDFGLTRTTKGVSETTKELATEGTPEYLSWRRALGKAASYHDELFSMALTILELHGAYTALDAYYRGEEGPEYKAWDIQFKEALEKRKVDPLLVRLHTLAVSGLQFDEIPPYDELIAEWEAQAKAGEKNCQ